LLSTGVAEKRPLKLAIKLLVNSRDHHGSGRPWDFNPFIEQDPDGLYVRHPNWFTLTIKTRGGSLQSDMAWYDNFHLSTECERGLPDVDSHLCVGEAMLNLDSEEWVGIVASTEDNPSCYLTEAMRRHQVFDEGQLKRSQVTMPALIDAPEWISQLVLATSSFIFSRPLPDVPDGESIIAGYPWFGDWGRDTMIALPGLTLATGRFDTASRILNTFARFISQGMLPNVFPGAGDTPEYNTVDAALWYIEAWRAYVAAIHDIASLKQVFAVLADIIDWHVKGTRYQIKVDNADGLLYAGEEGVQITWMDAKVGDYVVTPRIGKPVEINALWYNALTAMAEFATMLNEPASQYQTLAEKAKAGFKRFIKADGTGLADVLDGPNGDDFTLRPNQIFAVSLHASPLDDKTQHEVLSVCGRELLTSYGLRSLNVGNPEFKPHYQGGVWQRDTSYHQGPIWAFLLGHYALAEYRVSGDAAKAQANLEPIRNHLADAALGSVSEIFDGDPPHTPRGAPAQAWSAACTLEAWAYLERQKNEKMRAISGVKTAASAGKAKVAA
jgi:predicted glycogen debranching enzyme